MKKDIKKAKKNLNKINRYFSNINKFIEDDLIGQEELKDLNIFLNLVVTITNLEEKQAELKAELNYYNKMVTSENQ